MSTSCLSKVSSLELLLSFEGGPCAETAARVDVARLQSRCSVSGDFDCFGLLSFGQHNVKHQVSCIFDSVGQRSMGHEL